MKRKSRLRRGQALFFPKLLCLALFFLGGVILGQAVSSGVPDETGRELQAYLQGYLSLESGVSGSAVWSALVLYFRYPILAVLLGFCSVGVILLPVTAAAFGFFLSFSVCCFTAAFGPDGILLALTVFGLRCLISLPCFFLLAVPAWEASVHLALAAFGGGRRTAPIRYGRDWWRRVACCSAGLLAGAAFELFCSPWLLRLVLNQILI